LPGPPQFVTRQKEPGAQSPVSRHVCGTSEQEPMEAAQTSSPSADSLHPQPSGQSVPSASSVSSVQLVAQLPFLRQTPPPAVQAVQGTTCPQLSTASPQTRPRAAQASAAVWQTGTQRPPLQVWPTGQPPHGGVVVVVLVVVPVVVPVVVGAAVVVPSPTATQVSWPGFDPGWQRSRAPVCGSWLQQGGSPLAQRS
jgi:hypothetical protein